MKYIVASLAAMTAFAIAVMPAGAQSSRSGEPGQKSTPAEVVAAAFTGEVTGKVEKVDPASGMLTLSTVDGPVNVRFPPPAVQAIQPGDQVTVAFGLVKAPPSASPPTSPGSRPPGSPGSPTR